MAASATFYTVERFAISSLARPLSQPGQIDMPHCDSRKTAMTANGMDRLLP
jgi:hypothetical protein